MSITVQFQTIQFSISAQFQCEKQIYFKRLNLAKVHIFYVKNSSISKQFNLA